MVNDSMFLSLEVMSLITSVLLATLSPFNETNPGETSEKVTVTVTAYNDTWMNHTGLVINNSTMNSKHKQKSRLLIIFFCLFGILFTLYVIQWTGKLAYKVYKSKRSTSDNIVDDLFPEDTNLQCTQVGDQQIWGGSLSSPKSCSAKWDPFFLEGLSYEDADYAHLKEREASSGSSSFQNFIGSLSSPSPLTRWTTFGRAAVSPDPVKSPKLPNSQSPIKFPNYEESESARARLEASLTNSTSSKLDSTSGSSETVRDEPKNSKIEGTPQKVKTI